MTACSPGLLAIQTTQLLKNVAPSAEKIICRIAAQQLQKPGVTQDCNVRIADHGLGQQNQNTVALQSYKRVFSFLLCSRNVNKPNV